MVFVRKKQKRNEMCSTETGNDSIIAAVPLRIVDKHCSKAKRTARTITITQKATKANYLDTHTDTHSEAEAEA